MKMKETWERLHFRKIVFLEIMFVSYLFIRITTKSLLRLLFNITVNKFVRFLYEILKKLCLKNVYDRQFNKIYISMTANALLISVNQLLMVLLFIDFRIISHIILDNRCLAFSLWQRVAPILVQNRRFWHLWIHQFFSALLERSAHQYFRLESFTRW